MFERLETIARHERYALVVLAIAIPVAIGCYATAALSATKAKPAATPMMIVSEDDSGGEWISGRGDTCEDAWKNAVLPQGLTHVECVPDDSAN